jgi:hypothetical protein
MEVVKQVVKVEEVNNIINVEVVDELVNIEMNDISNITYNVTGAGILTTTFTKTDATLHGYKLIGEIPTGKRVTQCVLNITTAFNGSTQITVGDAVAQGRLMASSNTEPAVVQKVVMGVHDVVYASKTKLYIYFPVGIPTTGAGTIIIYYI